MPLEEEKNEADGAQVRALIRTYHGDNKSSAKQAYFSAYHIPVSGD